MSPKTLAIILTTLLLLENCVQGKGTWWPAKFEPLCTFFAKDLTRFGLTENPIAVR